MVDQLHDPASLRSFWKRVLHTRKTHSDLLVHGNLKFSDFDNADTMTYVKCRPDGPGGNEQEQMLVVLNFSESAQPVSVPEELRGKTMELYVSTIDGDVDSDRSQTDLEPWEGRLYTMR